MIEMGRNILIFLPLLFVRQRCNFFGLIWLSIPVINPKLISTDIYYIARFRKAGPVIWLWVVEDVRTIVQKQAECIYILDLIPVAG